MTPPSDINGRQHFNSWSETYERSFMQWLLFDRVHRGVLARIPANFVPHIYLTSAAAPAGCLRRMHLRWPSASWWESIWPEGMVARARQQTNYATIRQAPAEQLPLADGSVDLATSTTSFHHWSDQAQGVREAVRVLRAGGLFILADMNLSAHGHPHLAFRSAGHVYRFRAVHPFPVQPGAILHIYSGEKT